MKLFGVVFTVALSAVCVSADLNWDFGEWIPIPGRCASCEKGRIFYLQNEAEEASGAFLNSETKRKKKAFSSDTSTLIPSNDIFVLQPKSDLDDDSSRVQLVYLPEGSINDLRTAKVAKVKSSSKIHSRSVRSAPFPTEHLSFSDLISSGSRISFREISPRRPTALVAEKGKEREAQEQIQLLEAALNSPPEEVREGELPRVFIAPTHLPPPPGYVKIPLLPTQNQVESKLTLPGTFLTSEFHNQLPPGFVQVPLPEKVSQLSHAIPFVNPNSNPLLQNSLGNHNSQHQQQQHRQKPKQQHEPLNFKNLNVDFEQLHTENLRQPQHFNSQQDVQNLDQPIQQNIQTEQPVQQEFDVNQIARNHFNIRRPTKNTFENHESTQNFDGVQPPHEQNIHGNLDNRPHQQTFTEQQEKQKQLVSHPNQQTVSDHQNTATISEHFSQEPLFTTQTDITDSDHSSQRTRKPTSEREIVNEERIRQQRVRPQNTGNQESVQTLPVTSISPLANKPKSNSFFEIGSSVIKPQNNFDYDPFNNLPDFNTRNDYEQDFLLYDNPEFDFPTNLPERERISDTKQNDQEPKTFSQPQTEHSIADDKVSTTVHSDDIIATEDPKIVPFQLSPKPIRILPTLSPSPIETVSKESKVADVHSEFEQPTTPKSIRIRLSPKPIEETVNVDKVEENSPAQLSNRRRIRPTSFRGRTPSSSPRHRLNLSPKKVEDSQVTIGASVVTKDEISETPSSISPTLKQSLPKRSRFSNRRRRPFKQEITTTNELITDNASTPKPTESVSTLFPPFSVAKRLNENSPAATQETGDRRNPSGLRGRFGSRIRARAQDNDSTKALEIEGQDTLTTSSVPQRRRGQRRRRLRARNGQPQGQRRRRVLSRVRKIPEPTADSFDNQIQNEEQLSGAESARVLLTEVPLNKVPDPIVKTLTLISNESTNNVTESNTQSTEVKQIEPPTESSDTTGIAEGYVNNTELIYSSGHSLNEPSTILVSVDSQSSSPEHDTGMLDAPISKDINPTSSPFDAHFSSLSQNTQISTKSESHVEKDSSFVDLQHAPFHKADVNDAENLPPLNDNADTLLSENGSRLQDNYYDYDGGDEFQNNGSFIGSSASVVYAVALSDPSPHENYLTTQIPKEDFITDQETITGFQSSTDIENVADSLTLNTEESALDNLHVIKKKNVLSTNPQDEISESDSTLIEIVDTTESSFIHSESTTRYVDTTSIADEVFLESVTLVPDSENKELSTIANDMTTLEDELHESDFIKESFPLSEMEKKERLNTSEITTEINISNNELNTETNTESLNPEAKEPLNSGTENSTKTITEHTPTKSNSSLTNSFLETFFSPEREAKTNNLEVEEEKPVIIGRSTVTEVRSSAPVICINGNCVIGAGIKKR